MEFLNPSEILQKLELKEEMTAADFGCGSGGWVIPLAKILEDGMVYAIDVLEEPLSALRSKLALFKIFNIKPIKSNVEARNGSTLTNSSCDLVLMTNLLFECENKEEVIREGVRVLKPGGRILVVDWKKDNPLTPQIEKVSFEEIKEIAKKVGLKLEKEFSAGSYHNALILVR